MNLFMAREFIHRFPIDRINYIEPLFHKVRFLCPLGYKLWAIEDRNSKESSVRLGET